MRKKRRKRGGRLEVRKGGGRDGWKERGKQKDEINIVVRQFTPLLLRFTATASHGFKVIFLRIMRYFKLIEGHNSLYKFIYRIYTENLKHYTGCTAGSCIPEKGTISRTVRPYLL